MVQVVEVIDTEWKVVNGSTLQKKDGRSYAWDGDATAEDI